MTFTACQLSAEVTDLIFAAVLWFGSLMMVPCGPKHVGMLSAIL